MREADFTGPGAHQPLRADAEAIAHAAGLVLDSVRALADTTRPALSTLDTDPTWFGSLPSASALSGSHLAGLTDTQAAVERLGTALELDADGLYQVAFSTAATDQGAAHRLGTGWN
jgi:hypothetical protein